MEKICSIYPYIVAKCTIIIHESLLTVKPLSHGGHAISLDFDHPLSYYTRKKVTYELVTHEYNKLEVGE